MDLFIMGIFMIISFFVGYKLGSPKKEIPKPIKKIFHKKSEDITYNDPVQIMLENIDNYNGTSVGQQDVPEDEEVL